MADALYINGTQVHPDRTCFGYGTCNAVALEWGTPDADLFLDAKPLMDGRIFRGRVTKDRRFTLALLVGGVSTLAKGQDVWEDVLDLVNANNGLVAYRYVRNDGAGGTVDRTILGQVIGEPAWTWRPGGSEDGLRPNGNVRVTLPCVAPFPWWRSTDYTETNINATGEAAGNAAITRSGQLPCGLEVKVTTAGALAAITISDGNRSMVLTATFGASVKGVDWYHADPAAIAIDSGVTVSAGGFLSMHSATTTITATPAAGSTGAHVIRVRHYPLWKVV